MKRYILVVIAGIAIAAYVIPTSGWLDLNTAFAGGKNGGGGGNTECEGGDAEGGDGGVAIATISQSVSQSSDQYKNTATLVNTGDAEADADGGDGGDGGDCEIGGYYGSGDVELEGGDGGKGGDGGVAIASISQSVTQNSQGGSSPINSLAVDGTTGGDNTATVVNTGDAEASAEGGDGGDGGDAEGGEYGSKEEGNHENDEGDVEAEGGDGGDGGDGGVAIASIDQDVEQDSSGGDNEATVVNSGDAEADADGGDGGDGGDAEVEED
jgi:hypothetical protein